MNPTVNAPAMSQLMDTTKIVDPNTLQFSRAIKDDAEAYSICKRLIQDSLDRNGKAAAIMRKYNDEQPWSPEKLKAAGQGWRRNASTGFMSSLIKRILPSYKQVVDSARVLTSSRLKEVSPKADQKTEDFRIETTKTIRQWTGWHPFVSQIVLENVLFGYTGSSWTDEYEWRPSFCRQDESYFPDGCPQEPRGVPLWMKIQNFLIHELAGKISDPKQAKVSESVGWNITNLVTAINNAMPENRQKGNIEDQRKYEDTVRESTRIGMSYREGVRVIETYHLFVQEFNGKVSHYIIDKKTTKALFTKLDRFNSMDETISLFTIEVGNGKLHGSKGAGRVLYNTHVGIEQSRNLIADMLYLSGLLLVKASSAKGKVTAAITVQHPVGVIGEGFDVAEQQFKVNHEAFFALDRHFTGIAEMQVGAFIPGQMLDSAGAKPTASQVNYVASVEQQIKEGLLSRFWGQMLMTIFQMQKRIYSKDNIAEAMRQLNEKRRTGLRRVTQKMYDFLCTIAKSLGGREPAVQIEPEMLNKEAVEACACLLNKGLTAEELFELANCPPNEITEDMAIQNAQAMDAIVARYLNDKSIRQIELKKRDIASKMGNTIADELIIPEEDQTIMQEAVRMQLMEMGPLLEGDPLPVSPRDIDEIHLMTMQQKAGKLFQTLQPGAVTPETLKIVQNVLAHFDAHIQSAIGKGMKPDGMKQFSDFSAGIHKLIESVTGAPMAPTESSLPPGAVPPMNPSDMANGPQTLDASASNPTMPPVPKVPNQPQGMPLSEGPMNLQPKVSP